MELRIQGEIISLVETSQDDLPDGAGVGPVHPRGFLYLVAIMDWATSHVLAWRLSNTMDAGVLRRGTVPIWQA